MNQVIDWLNQPAGVTNCEMILIIALYFIFGWLNYIIGMYFGGYEKFISDLIRIIKKK